MKKVIKIGFPIVCIAIIGGTFYMLGKLDKKVEGSLKNQYNNTENTVEESENNISSNEENFVQENVVYTVPVEETSLEDEENSNMVDDENNADNSSDETDNNIDNTVSNEVDNTIY